MRQGVEIFNVRLKADQLQTQVVGLKFRALSGKESKPRHMYTTEWRLMDSTEGENGDFIVITDNHELPFASEQLSARVPRAAAPR